MKGTSTFYRKAFKAALATTVATGAMVTALPNFGQANENGFKDLDKSQDYYADVLNLMARNVVQGFPDGTYKPHRTLTRGQAAKILARTLKLDVNNVPNPGFSDVKETDEYYGAIAALANAGIISGYADNTFGQAKTLTRSQMAKMIAIGFNLSEEKQVDSIFTDVKESDAFSGYVHSLIANNITKGTTKTTFSPRNSVTRGQMASFIVRSEKAVVNEDVDVDVTKEMHAIIEGFTENAIVLSTGTFPIPADLKNVLVAENMEALKGAVLKYSITSDATVKLHSVELKASGTSAKKVVFDGKNSTFPGNFIVSGDYTTVQNITIQGDLEIGEGVENDFLGKDMTVEGSTNISDKIVEKELTQASSDKVYKSLAFSIPVHAAASTVAANTTGATIVFMNSKLNLVNLMNQFSSIQLLGTTKVGRVIVSINANVLIGKGVVVPEVLLKGDAEFLIAGEGEIEVLNVESPSAKIVLSGQTIIGNLVIPAGSKAADIIQDYEKVKKYILKINGVSNVIVKPVTPPSYEPDIPNVVPPTPPIIVAPTAVAFSGITANGVSNDTSTTELTLTFDKDPGNLQASNITVTGATKGVLSGTGKTRTLTISGITVANGGDITVALTNPAGITLSTDSRTVAVNVAPTAVAFSGITTNGESNKTSTTELVLAFDKDPGDLQASDITVTGATKGTLTGTGMERTLTISDITVANGGDVIVELKNPTGISFTTDSRTVAVNVAPTAVEFSGITANGVSNDTSTTELTLEFDKDPGDLQASDITVTGATIGVLTGTGTTRTLTISDITVANGEAITITLTNPTGISFTTASQTVAVNVTPE